MAGNLKLQAQKILTHNTLNGLSIEHRRARAKQAREGNDGSNLLSFQILKGQGDGQLDKLINIQQQKLADVIDATTDVLEYLKNKLGDMH